MKLLVVNNHLKASIVESEILPRIGDSVDMFYSPRPKVSDVILWPSKETLGEFSSHDVSAVVVVS